MLVYLIFFLQIITFILIYLLFKSKKYLPQNFISREEISLYRQAQEEFLKELNNLTEFSISRIENKLNEMRELLNLVEEKTLKIEEKAEKQPENVEEEKRQEEKSPKIYELRDKGWSIYEIAKEVGISKGEVELILNLRKNK